MASVLRTDTGKVREQNEDSAWLDESLGIFAVADGMGGYMAGEIASRLTIEAVEEAAKGYDHPTEDVLRRMVRDASRRIRRYVTANPECERMGTTLSCMWLSGDHAYITHIGDSRVYRLRSGRLDQITEDHSLVAELLAKGVLTPQQAREYPYRNVITRALSASQEEGADVLLARCRPGDVWLLCSDGLCGYVEDETIRSILCEHQDLEAAADALIKATYDVGAPDNVTLILYRAESRREAFPWNKD